MVIRAKALTSLEGHARSADVRLEKYLGTERFAELDLGAGGAAAKNADQSDRVSATVARASSKL